MANAKESPTLVAATASEVAKNNGTIHVRIVSARGLPVDYGTRLEPVVLVELDSSSPVQWGTTDPAATGGVAPKWEDYQNREIELFYDATLQAHEAILTFQVFSNDSMEQLIGTGQFNVSNIAKNKTSHPEKIQPVKLKESLTSNVSRGELSVEVWFGPPVRKAFRAAQRISKVLDARDHVVGSVWSLGLNASAPFAKYLKTPVDYLKKNRKISVALAALLGVVSACATALFLMIAVPTATVAAFTFPFWIIPFLIAAFFTAPVWIPIVLLVGVFLAFVGAFCVGLGVTSRPVRRKGAMLSSRIKHSDVGKRVVYEKTAE